jgi:hypothetical protein
MSYSHFKNFWEGACYVGVIPALLCVISPFWLWKGRQRGAAQFWTVLFAFCLALSFGKEGKLYIAAFHFMPGVNMFHDPARFLLGSSIAAAVIAAMMMERIVRYAKFNAAALAVVMFAFACTIPDLGIFDRAIYPIKSISEINQAPEKSKLVASLKDDPILKKRMGRVLMVDSERPWSYFTSYTDYHDDLNSFIVQWMDTSVPNLLMGVGVMESGGYEPISLKIAMDRALNVRKPLSKCLPLRADFAGSMAVDQVIAFRPSPLPKSGALQRLKMYQTKDGRDNIYYYRNLLYRPRARFVTSKGEAADMKKYGAPVVYDENADSLSVSLPPSLESRTLLLADTYYPGWGASIGKTLYSVSCTGDGFRKVIVPPEPLGSKIEFKYNPETYQVGVYLTLIGLAFVMASLGAGMVQGAGKPPRRRLDRRAASRYIRELESARTIVVDEPEEIPVAAAVPVPLPVAEILETQVDVDVATASDSEPIYSSFDPSKTSLQPSIQIWDRERDTNSSEEIDDESLIEWRPGALAIDSSVNAEQAADRRFVKRSGASDRNDS